MKNGLNPTAVVTVEAGGTFSSTPGLSINTTSGLIDLDASTAGTYDISYTAADNDGNGTPDEIIHLNR